MLSESEVRRLLSPFALSLSSEQISKLNLYLETLLAWNRRINLTSVRTPEECVTRHFGESLFLARWHSLKGSLLDVGSGAGFPALAMKIAFPDLAATLLEPVAKKRAFLKEVARVCEFKNVEVRAERLESYRLGDAQNKFDVGTSRAVCGAAEIARMIAGLVRAGGMLFMWLGEDEAGKVLKEVSNVNWLETLPIPQSRKRKIVCGIFAGNSREGEFAHTAHM